MKLLALLSVLMLAAPGVGRAQSEAPSLVTAKFRTLGWGTSVEGLFFAQKQADVPVQILADGRSSFFDYSGPNPIEFFRIIPDADGKPQRQVVATADLSHGGKWPLLIFFKRPGKEERFVVKFIPEDLKSFPGGSFRFLNLSSTQVAAALAGESIKLPPLADKILDKTPAAGRTTLLCQVLAEVSGSWKLLYSDNWAYSKIIRTLVLVSPGDRPSEFRVQRLPESADFSYLAPQKPDATPSAP